MDSFATPAKWYDRTWLVVVLCIVFFPVGLYALWKSNTIGKTGKLAGTAAVAALAIYSWTRPAPAPGTTAANAAAEPTEEATPKELTAAEKAAAARAAVKEQEDQTLTAPSLLASYKANEVRADNNFKGKDFYVEGTVDKVGKDIMDHSYVILKGDEYGILGVQCTLEDPSEAANLDPGDYIAVKGKCDGLMMNVLMGDSHIVPTVASLKRQAKLAKK